MNGRVLALNDNTSLQVFWNYPKIFNKTPNFGQHFMYLAKMAIVNLLNKSIYLFNKITELNV